MAFPLQRNRTGVNLLSRGSVLFLASVIVGGFSYFHFHSPEKGNGFGSKGGHQHRRPAQVSGSAVRAFQNPALPELSREGKLMALIKKRMADGSIPESLQFYQEQYHRALDLLISKNYSRKAADAKLCGEKIYMACSSQMWSYYSDLFKNIEMNPDTPDATELLVKGTPDIRYLANLVCVHTGIDCYKAISMAEGTEMGRLLTEIVGTYCDASLARSCADMVEVLNWPLKGDSSQRREAQEKIVHIGMKYCNYDDTSLCPQVVDALDESDPRKVLARDTIYSSCESGDDNSCDNGVRYAMKAGDLERAYSYASSMCDRGYEGNCLAMAKIEYLRTGDIGAARPALYLFCMRTDTNSSDAFCRELKTGRTLDRAFLRSADYLAATSPSADIVGNLWSYFYEDRH